MGQKFKISVRKVEDYEIEVSQVELARLLGCDAAEIDDRLSRAGTITNGEEVATFLYAAPGDLLPQWQRRKDAFEDAVTSVELHQPDRVKSIKHDRIVDGVTIIKG